MRNLNTSDTFKFVRMIRDLNLKEEIRKIILDLNAASKGDKESKENKMDVGFNIIFTLIEKIAEENSEKALYEFLSGPFEINAEEVGKIEIFDLVEKVMQIATIDKWKSFLKLAIR